MNKGFHDIDCMNIFSYERLHKICACIYVVNGDRLCASYMERCV